MEKGNEVATGGTSAKQVTAGSGAGPGAGSTGGVATAEVGPFTRPDGSPMTQEELREEAASDVAFAHGVENTRNERIAAGEQNRAVLADLEGMADRARKRAAALRQEAERLEQLPKPELPSGSMTNPDGTRIEMERLPDGTQRETTFDSQGNVLSTRVVEKLPGDWARSEHTDEG